MVGGNNQHWREGRQRIALFLSLSQKIKFLIHDEMKLKHEVLTLKGVS